MPRIDRRFVVVTAGLALVAVAGALLVLLATIGRGAEDPKELAQWKERERQELYRLQLDEARKVGIYPQVVRAYGGDKLALAENAIHEGMAAKTRKQAIGFFEKARSLIPEAVAEAKTRLAPAYLNPQH